MSVRHGLGRLGRAAEAFRAAAAAKPSFAETHCNLGHVLLRLGKIQEGLQSLEKGHQLGSKKQNWRYASQVWVDDARALLQLESELGDYLKGERTPRDGKERGQLLRLCLFKGKFVDAVHFGEPLMKEDLRHRSSTFRFDLARAAASAAKEAGVKDSDRIRFRVLARQLIEEELQLWETALKKPDPRLRRTVRNVLNGWKRAQQFNGLRKDELLTKLPEAERKTWRNLWQRLDASILSIMNE